MSFGKKIIWLDQNSLVSDARLRSFIRTHSSGLIDMLVARAHMMSRVPAWNVRFGKNFMPFHDTAREFLDPRSALPSLLQSPSFGDITDARCHELITAIGQHPWSVLWSGGVDSTVIVTSLLKNLTPSQRDRVTIYCNLSSIAEDPVFYQKHITRNFRVLDTHLLPDLHATDHHIITGEMGDQIAHGITFNLGNNLAGLADKKWRRNGGQLIDWLCARGDQHDHTQMVQKGRFARWLYENMQQNIDQLQVPINTIQDWVWWFPFNLAWISIKLQLCREFDWPIALAKNRMWAWYDNNQYQAWSLLNLNTGLKGDLSWPCYKPQAKQYIYDYTKDQYRYRYKIKTNSVSTKHSPRQWFCLLDDYSQLYLDQDFPVIQALLPDYFRSIDDF